MKWINKKNTGKVISIEEKYDKIYCIVETLNTKKARDIEINNAFVLTNKQFEEIKSF